jgi:hypothetical protein
LRLHAFRQEPLEFPDQTCLFLCLPLDPGKIHSQQRLPAAEKTCFQLGH